MGLSTFNRNREKADEERRRGKAPPPPPRPTTEQALRDECASLEAALAEARARCAELERELEAATAPPEPREPQVAHRGRR